MKFSIISGVLGLAILVSCTESTDPGPRLSGDAYARWKSHNITHYTIEESRNCFCPSGGKWVRVEVRNDSVLGVVDIANDTLVSQMFAQQCKSVDQLFAVIASIDTHAVASFEVCYDSIHGYPVSFFVDPDSRIVDEEYGYSTRNLVFRVLRY